MKGGKRRPGLLLGGLAALLLLAVLLSLSLGAVRFPPRALWALLVSRGDGAAEPMLREVFFQVRLPRVLLAMLSGCCLALSGTLMQGVFRNPLSDPYLLGIASGATAGAALAVALRLPGGVWVQGAALLGGTVAVALVYLLAHRRDALRLDRLALVLSGLALSALFSSITSLALYLADSDDLRRIVSFLLGSLGGASWELVYPLLGVTVLGLVVAQPLARDLNALALGELTAWHLGVPAVRVQRLLLALATLLTAPVVAAAGTIGFVGLIIPHAMRLWLGPDHRLLLPTSALFGALFLLLCDTVARTALAPVEVPVGIITALCGAPLFLYLLLQRRGGER